MKINAVQLTNFRQFYGQTPKIEFSTSRDKNVTVIHGMNGAGKTALLNSLTWLFYGTFSRGFRSTEQLINRRAVAETATGKKVSCKGELWFEDSGISYWLKKEVDAVVESKQTYPICREKEPVLQFFDKSEWKAVSDVESAIGRILPKALHSYFFFDGERVEKIVEPGKEERNDLGKAVSHEIEGKHHHITGDMMRKAGFDEATTHAAEAHHDDIEATTSEALIVRVVDALSGGRPGARGDKLENYVKRMTDLENVTNAFSGIKKSYAISAGREIRIFVNPEEIDDLSAIKLARDVATKIEATLKYPGTIKVNIIRETRAEEYAK